MYCQGKHEVPGDYQEVINYLETNYEEVLGDQFYSEIFPDNEVSGEMHTDFSHPNAIYLYKGEDERMHRRIMLKDTWETEFQENVERNELALCSGLSYRGMKNRLPNAQRMHAMIFDVDNVGPNELDNILYRANNQPRTLLNFAMPMPTYIVTSGSGLHLYYVFTEPLDLYPNIKLQAKQLKYDRTAALWDFKSTSREKDVQYQGIAQGFRMVGSINEKYGTVVRAFRTGEKIPFEFFNQFAREQNQVDLKRPFRPSQVSLEEAKIKYPEWYQKRIVEKHAAGHWVCKKDLYNWWIRQVDNLDMVRGGHRYFYLMCLSIYATKCDVSRDELYQDMIKLMPKLDKIDNKGDPFTMRDVNSAIEAYDKAYYCFTIADIERLMNYYKITRNRRNYRPQKIHLMGARALQNIKHQVEGTNWREGNGRPKGSGTKKEIIKNWRMNHPGGIKADCIRETGISKPTVLKWWNSIDEV